MRRWNSRSDHAVRMQAAKKDSRKCVPIHCEAHTSEVYMKKVRDVASKSSSNVKIPRSMSSTDNKAAGSGMIIT